MPTLSDIVNRAAVPVPWAEGYKIPWNDPEFSARMLGEHLSQSHDMASRRLEKIDRQVAWIHEAVLGGVPGHVLDLGCGPGLYGARLAALGHAYTGIDFSPASIEYAQCRATLVGDAGCVFALGDVRQADFAALDAGRGLYDLAMFVFGEFNVFSTDDIADILRRVHAVLRPGGRLLLEPHTFGIIRQIGEAGVTWYSSPGGLFNPAPHLMLQESFWDAESATATTRYYVVDAASGNVAAYAQSMQAYTTADYTALLTAAGFDEVTYYPSLLGKEDPDQPHLLAIVAQRA
jgi:SAM-dependent methyltransferase